MFSKLLKIAAALFVIVLLSNAAPAFGQCVEVLGPVDDDQLGVSSTYRPCDSDFKWTIKFHRTAQTTNQLTFDFSIKNGHGASLVSERYNSRDFREGDYSFNGQAVDFGAIAVHTMSLETLSAGTGFFESITGVADYR